MTSPRSESWILFDILKAWGSHPQLRIWRQNTGVAEFDGRAVRFGTPGQADISGLIAPLGKRLEIECKTATGRQSPAQKSFQAMVEKFGGLYVLARSLADVDAAFARLGIHR